MVHTQHRVMGVIILLLSLAIAIGFFYIMKFLSVPLALFFALPIFILINLLYQMGSYRHLEKKESKLNILSQMWVGFLGVIASLIMIILLLTTGVDVAIASAVLSVFFIAGMFLTIKHYDRYLEEHSMKE